MCDDCEDNSWDDYESGPYCRHWNDPSSCDERCKNCGELCGNHYYDSECQNYEDSE